MICEHVVHWQFCWSGTFQFQTLLNCYFNIFCFKFTMDTSKNALMTIYYFHIAIVLWIYRPSVMSVISEFSLIWTTDYWIWSLFLILKFYTCDTFVISTKRYEKPSGNTSTVDRDAWCYMWGRFRISTAINLFFHLWNFEIKLSHGLTDALVFWHQVMIASPVVRFISEIKPVRFLWNI